MARTMVAGGSAGGGGVQSQPLPSPHPQITVIEHVVAEVRGRLRMDVRDRQEQADGIMS